MFEAIPFFSKKKKLEQLNAELAATRTDLISVQSFMRLDPHLDDEARVAEIKSRIAALEAKISESK